jgi:hypothetical protein
MVSAGDTQQPRIPRFGAAPIPKFDVIHSPSPASPALSLRARVTSRLTDQARSRPILVYDSTLSWELDPSWVRTAAAVHIMTDYGSPRR